MRVRIITKHGISHLTLVSLGGHVDSLLLAKRARLSAIKMVHSAKAAHIGSSLSVIDLLAVLYADVAQIDPMNPTASNRDIVLISKGHAAAGYFAILAHAGFFSTSALDTYCDNGGDLGGHVTSGSVPGVEFSTGSLGHALPFANGIALADAFDKRSRKIYVILSDGECDEGSNWEAALIAGSSKFNNLHVIIDRNGLQSLTSTENTVALEPLDDKWRSFGWDVQKVDGHNHDEIRSALSREANSKPLITICETVKGKGVHFMENMVLWHYRSPNDSEYSQAIEEVESR